MAGYWIRGSVRRKEVFSCLEKTYTTTSLLARVTFPLETCFSHLLILWERNLCKTFSYAFPHCFIWVLQWWFWFGFPSHKYPFPCLCECHSLIFTSFVLCIWPSVNKVQPITCLPDDLLCMYPLRYGYFYFITEIPQIIKFHLSPFLCLFFFNVKCPPRFTCLTDWFPGGNTALAGCRTFGGRACFGGESESFEDGIGVWQHSLTSSLLLMSPYSEWNVSSHSSSYCYAFHIMMCSISQTVS